MFNSSMTKSSGTKPILKNLKTVHYNKQSGLLLVEAMVAVALFSIAIMGLSALQLTNSKSNLSAMLRTETTVSITEIIDLMRANIEGVEGGDYNRDFDDDHGAPFENQADRDIDRWLVNLNTAFSGESGENSFSTVGSINCAGILNRVCTVRIQWDDQRAQEDPAEPLFTVSSVVTF